MRRTLSVCLAGLIIFGSFSAAHAEDIRPDVSLSGSEESMSHQNRVARKLGLRFVRTPSEFPRLLGDGSLVALAGNHDYEVLDRVPYPYARPEVRVFIERLAAEYREATGEKLVVTSLTRPSTRQPGNSHYLSVHPAGIAMDLRISSKRRSSQWLERHLLRLEREGLLDVTRERRPPHFHVALFPDAYMTSIGEGEDVGKGGREDVRTRDGWDVMTRDVTAPVSAGKPSAAVVVAPAEWETSDVFEDAGEVAASNASLLGSLTEGDRDWLPLVVSLPLIGLVVGALGFRRKTRVLPSYPNFIPPPPPQLSHYGSRNWHAAAPGQPAYPSAPQWQPLDRCYPVTYHGDGAPYLAGRVPANRTARPTHSDNSSAVWHP